ncbi:MAG: hypothetical protein HRU41_23560 [Saprospiraceae bacterium]|nr:hypothetical protein [Saprospiraceae bacterium]
MTLLTHLESYITAQKNVGSQFIIIGVLLLIVAAWAHFSATSPLSSGLKTGALIGSLLILAGGFGYRSTETTLLKKQTALFQEDQTEFRQVETERMAKVKKDYPVYQMVFSAFIVAALLVILSVKNTYWHGISFAVIILMVGVLISEAYSQQSIQLYYEYLTN